MIHPTAIIEPGAKLHPSVEVGPYAIIGPKVTIGPETTIGAHAVIDGTTEIGARNRIFPGVAIGLEPQDLKYDGAESFTKIGDGNTLREYVTVNRATGAGEFTVIGDNNLLMAYVHVAHNCSIGHQVVIANNVSLAGHVHIDSRAVIGGVLGIHQFVHIGKLSMVGGMSRIERDVPPFMLVEGNPCRVRVLNQVGLKRAGLSEDDRSLLKQAFKILYRSGLTLNQALDKLDLLADNDYIQHLSGFLRASLGNSRRGPIPGIS
ncbi:acyl-ACP--UDP-N-acetylglucosamine O-acyltransferase [[Phormidium] sp. ETS-05]|uniref:acyl-ACP--UDP-N-acetylglucosamine O-acyltransferase n=1 Tax=[Phormidium] sp. ETS-05 TaxID=222819 RepID=UPI0018EEEB49|nr:acyl-ACP--UDP-N-acetylglucosamine O-acyltransferase [[Phormidium] sp. ETS-05]